MKLEHFLVLTLQIAGSVTLCVAFPSPTDPRSCGTTFTRCPEGSECVNWICTKASSIPERAHNCMTMRTFSGNRSCGKAFLFCQTDEICENNICVKSAKCAASSDCTPGHECFQDHCARRRDCPILDLPILPPRDPPCILTEEINARGCLQPRIDCALPKSSLH